MEKFGKGGVGRPKNVGIGDELGHFGGCTIMTRKIREDVRNGEGGGKTFFFKMACCARKYPFLPLFNFFWWVVDILPHEWGKPS